MIEITRWVATLHDGSEMTSDEFGSIERAHERGAIRRLLVNFSNGDHVTMACAPELGHAIKLFTRRAIQWIEGDGDSSQKHLAVPVAEIRHSDGSFVRLYMTEDGPVMSSMDLNIG